MAISLKNVDDRLKVLEGIKNQQISEMKTGESGYIRFFNGVMIQWWVHRGSIDGGWTTTTYPRAFSAKPWTIIGCLLGNNVSSRYDNNLSIRFNAATASNVQVYQAGASYSSFMSTYIAIGI